jgi:hypothetical protein
MEPINRVANSGLVSIYPAEWLPKIEQVGFDITQCLYMGLILKEKDFRQFIKEHNWQAYQNKAVALFCSADAIIPTWAYMLLASALKPYESSGSGFWHPTNLGNTAVGKSVRRE